MRKDKIIVIICSLFMLLIGLQIAGFQYLTIYIAEEYEMSGSEIGLISSIQFIPMFAVPLFFGNVLDRYSKKILSAICALCYVAGSLFIILIHSVISLVLGIFVIAVGASVSPAMILVLLTEMMPEKSRQFSSLSEVFYSLGNVVSPLALSVLVTAGMNWRGLYYFVSGLSLAIGVILLFSRTGSTEELRQAKDKKKFRFGISLVLLMGYALLYNMIEIGFMNYCSSYFTSLFNDSYGAGISISLVGFAMVISKLISTGFKWNKGSVIMICSGLSACSSLLMILFPGKISSLVWCALFGLLTGPAWPTLMSYGIELYPDNPGRASTLMMLGGGIGGIIVGPLMGTVSDISGIAWSYLVPCLAAAIGAIVIFILKISLKKGIKAE
ncbi:MAG: MFS transporter [Clostridia bacterium]|nr:MFS transporter [Clostridia bacterium]